MRYPTPVHVTSAQPTTCVAVRLVTGVRQMFVSHRNLHRTVVDRAMVKLKCGSVFSSINMPTQALADNIEQRHVKNVFTIDLCPRCRKTIRPTHKPLTMLTGTEDRPPLRNLKPFDRPWRSPSCVGCSCNGLGQRTDGKTKPLMLDTLNCAAAGSNKKSHPNCTMPEQMAGSLRNGYKPMWKHVLPMLKRNGYLVCNTNKVRPLGAKSKLAQ